MSQRHENFAHHAHWRFLRASAGLPRHDPARGIVMSLLLSAPMWALAALLLWWSL
jgi:hypothetical protein